MAIGMELGYYIKPSYGSVIEWVLYFIGITIIGFPNEYKTLQTKEERTKINDERYQLIQAKAGTKTNTIMTWIFSILIILCLLSQDFKGIAVLLGIILIIQNILLFAYEKYYANKL